MLALLTLRNIFRCLELSYTALTNRFRPLSTLQLLRRLISKRIRQFTYSRHSPTSCTSSTMPKFITRVELHGPTQGEDYSKLHSAMEKHGFSRTITSDKGNTYHLPTAEYYRFGPSLTSQQVGSEAQAAAATVRPKHAALVTEAGHIRWDGLPLV